MAGISQALAGPCEMAVVRMLRRRFCAAGGVAGFSHPKQGEVTRRGRYGGVTESPRKEGVLVGGRPSCPLHQTRPVAGRWWGFAWFFPQELQSEPPVLKVTLLCKATEVLVL